MRNLPVLLVALVLVTACEDDATSPAEAPPPAPTVRVDGGAPPDGGPAPEEPPTNDPETGVGLYALDYEQAKILRFNLEDGTIEKTFGKLGTGRGEFSRVRGIAATDRHIFIADTANHRIVRLLDLEDAGWAEWVLDEAARPYDVAASLEGATERLLFSDYLGKGYFYDDGGVFSGAPTPGAVVDANACGVALKPDGEAGSAGCSSGVASNVIVTPKDGVELHKGGLNRPDALAYFPDGTLAIANLGSSRVVCALGPSAGAVGTVGSDTDTQFLTLGGITVDRSGRLYVADSERNRIVRFDDCKGANPKVLFDGGPEVVRFGGLAAVGPR